MRERAVTCMQTLARRYLARSVVMRKRTVRKKIRASISRIMTGKRMGVDVVQGAVDERTKRAAKAARLALTDACFEDFDNGGRWMLLPSGSFRTVWDLSMALSVVYICAAAPWHMAFSVEPGISQVSERVRTCPLTVCPRRPGFVESFGGSVLGAPSYRYRGATPAIFTYEPVMGCAAM